MEPSNRRRVLRALEVTIGSDRPFSSYGPGLEAYPPTPFTMIGIRLATEVVADRIAARYADQVAAGFVDEMRRLRADSRGMSRTARQALGYKELLAHLDGDLTVDDAIDLAVRRTRRFARRQRVWFGRDPRIRWFDAATEPMSLLDGVAEAVT
jgi:tRNA dimethylallyltransferase